MANKTEICVVIAGFVPKLNIIITFEIGRTKYVLRYNEFPFVLHLWYSYSHQLTITNHLFRVFICLL